MDMLYAIVPVTNGEPDLDWANPPIESYQLSDRTRHCKFKVGEARTSWQVITEAEYHANKPATSPPVPEPTIADLQAQIDDLGAGLVQVMLVLGGGADGVGLVEKSISAGMGNRR